MTQAQQLKDVRRINAAGQKLALRKANAIRKRAVSAFQRNESIIEVRDILIDGYKDILVRAMKVAYLAGWRRIESEALKQSFKFSELGDMERVLGRLADLPTVEDLERQLESRAIRVLQDSTDEIESKLRKKVNELISEGATTRRGTQELGKTFDSLGLTPRNSYQIENLFRTQTQLVYGAAKDHAEQSPEVQEILWGYKYLTVGDNRVRDEHERMEGVVFEKDDPLIDRWYPHNGWSCRCQLVPLFDRPPGRIKRPPSDVPEVDPQFAFRPGSILRPPPSSGKLVVPKPLPRDPSFDLNAYERAKQDPGLGIAGITVKESGRIQVKKPRNISMARAQLEKIQQLRDAAYEAANAAKSLPPNSEEKVKAELLLRHTVQQYERVVRNVRSFLN